MEACGSLAAARGLMRMGTYEQARDRRAFASALASLVLGLFSICAGDLAIIGLVAGATGIIFALRGRRSVARHRMASAGLSLSTVGVAIGILITAWWVVAGLKGYGWCITLSRAWLQALQ